MVLANPFPLTMRTDEKTTPAPESLATVTLLDTPQIALGCITGAHVKQQQQM